ncbi:hypothetical protein C0431_13185 [bacterium]|nr:hypothetical protein [bacterium]
MGQLINLAIRRAKQLRNAPGGKGGAINRDPKANQVRRIGYQDVPNGGGRDNFETPEADLSRIKEAFKRDSYMQQASLKYVELILKMGYDFWSEDQTALDYIKKRFEMIEIATDIPFDALLEQVAKDLVESGNVFMAKARAKGGIGLPPGISVTPMPPNKEPVAGYFPLPPESMSVARDKNGKILTWQQEIQGVGDPIALRPENVVHFPFNPSSGKVFGQSLFAPVIEDVLALRKAEENMILQSRRFAFPTIKYKVGQAKEERYSTDEEIEEVKAELENADLEAIHVMPERHDIEGVNIPMMDMQPGINYLENRVFSGVGLSAVDFGRGDTANRNTADAMTGIKSDRVKMFQHVIMTYFNKRIIEELLVEGGFDPYMNPDQRVELVFRETEIEQLIKRETHELYKYEHNAITFDELRSNLNLSPNVDEARLMHNFLGKGAEETSTAETDNKQKPENQSGKRSGPKKSTEFTESANDTLAASTRFEREARGNMWFESLKRDVVSAYREGYSSAGTVSKVAPDHHQLLGALVDGPRERYEQRIAEGDGRIVHLMELHAKICLMRAHWFGYAIAHHRNGCTKFQLKVEEDACSDCKARDGETMMLEVSGHGEQMFLLQVPPLHPNGEHVGLEAIY